MRVLPKPGWKADREGEMKNPVSVARHIQELPPYTPIEPFEVLSARLGRRPEEIIKLDANENPYGPSPRARQALVDLTYAHIYPDPESRLLRTALSAFTGAPVENLLAGSGADELIDLLLRVVLEPGDCVLNLPPTFGMYSFDTRLNAGKLVEVRRNQDFSLDLDAIQQAVETHRPKILFVTSPNNPDGSLLSQAMINKLLELPLLVVLDEAYIEFADPARLGDNLTQLLASAERENLVVLRTFSKWAALAGLRVGYGAFPAWLIPALWKAKQPYNVNVAASQAAMASLEDAEYLSRVVTRLVAERERLAAGLERIPYLVPYPSRSNFILCKIVEKDAAALKAELAMRYGIFVRYFNSDGLRDHIRISVSKPKDTDAVLTALGELA